MESRLRLVTSEYLLAEVDRTLREPEVRALRCLSDAQIGAFVTVLRDLATVVAGRYDVALVRRDPADNPVLACALEAGCTLRGDGRPQRSAAAQGRETQRGRPCPDRQPG